MAITLIRIDGKISEIGSNSSNARMRITINENFKNLIDILGSYEDALDIIIDYINGGLGSIDLHSDVNTTGINTPSVGDILQYNGVEWVPANVSDGGGGGAQFLPELDDVEDFNYPLQNNRVLLYNLNDNLWKNENFSFFKLSESLNIDENNLTNGLIGIRPDGTMYLSSSSLVNTFPKYDGNNIIFTELSLDYIDDLVLPQNPITSETYVLSFDGSKYLVIPDSQSDGIRNFIPETLEVTVKEDFQYIVFQSITIEGEMNVEGELVVL